MVAFPPSATAPKRVVVGFGPELAPILSLEMVAEDVKARRRKHATRKLVKVCGWGKLACPSSLFDVFFLSLSQTVFEGGLS